MANIKVKGLTDTSSIALNNQLMVLTNDSNNLVQNITVNDLLTNVLSSDSNNVLEKGNDGKLYVETPENITGELTNLTTTNKTTLVAAINEVDGDIASEVTNRVNADNNLQSQIDAINAASDVTDIVGTYAQLQAYDTTGLPDKSIIKVLQDESRQNETTYYRWVITGGVGAWVLIGEEGPYYTISQSDSKFATQATVGDLNNLATSDKSSIVNAMNELSSVLSPTQTADYIKNSKAIYSGEVSQNASILPQIKEMAHSTFDRSKFTVVGSPHITDDGVASGFSTSDYLKVLGLNNVSNNNTFIIKGSFRTPNSSTSAPVLFSNNTNSSTGSMFLQVQTAYNRFQSEIVGHSNLSVATAQNSVSPNTEYDFIWEYKTGVGVSLKFKEHSQETYTEFNSSGDDTFNINLELWIGALSWSPTTFNAAGYEIDLKQLSITVDGVEVFSGNRTGIDTIKPDDYTVVGTPNISADGIASGFSSDNQVKVPNTLPTVTTNDKWSIKYKFTLPQSASGSQVIIRFPVGGYGYVQVVPSPPTIYVQPFGTPIREISGSEFVWGATYEIENIFTGMNVITNVKRNGVSLTSSTNELPSTPVTFYLRYMVLGWYNNASDPRALTGSIDLNAFKIYVDGDLVYQPCLKIPYTESKTGSKIVSSTYRDRVNDMAEQFGYANYYTLSDTDFTLPQVELYGYIEKRARDIAHPVAQPFYRFSDEINDDEVRLEGAEVDKGLYLAIEQKLSAYCTAGSTPDKICLPDFRGRVPWGAGDYGYIAAGLPNITAKLGGYFNGASYALPSNISGVRFVDETGNTSTSISAQNHNTVVDASLSNSIYGNSTTVQPPAFKVRWLARYK